MTLIAVLVIYVDDGFLISFDDDVTRDTQNLLDRQWNVREWNEWGKDKTRRFLAGDYKFIPSENEDGISKTTISMGPNVDLGCKQYEDDGGILP